MEPSAAMRDDNASGRQQPVHVLSGPTSPKRSGNSSEDLPLPRSKRAKAMTTLRGQDVVVASAAPSLLSRLADPAVDGGSTSVSVSVSGSGLGGNLDRTGTKKRKKPRLVIGKEGPEPSSEPDRHPSIGYSIKGAASVQTRKNGSPGGAEFSLLDRMWRERDSD